MRNIVAILLFSSVCFAQSARVPTVTRTVQIFGDLERNLAAAGSSAKSQFLTADFEERLCAEPGTPLPRQDWLQHSHSKTANFTQEAVHSYGDVAIYSALRSHGQKSDMIVDTWKPADGGWKLSVRYRCPATGAKPAGSSLPKRY
jgi:hypothetical protein